MALSDSHVIKLLKDIPREYIVSQRIANNFVVVRCYN